MAEEKKSLFPLLILPVIWGTYYVASQKLVGFTSSFTSGLSIRFVVMLALIVIMAKRGELGLLWKTEGVRARLVMIGTLGFLLDWTAFLGLSMSSAATGTALLKCDVLNGKHHISHRLQTEIYMESMGLHLCDAVRRIHGNGN